MKMDNYKGPTRPKPKLLPPPPPRRWIDPVRAQVNSTPLEHVVSEIKVKTFFAFWMGDTSEPLGFFWKLEKRPCYPQAGMTFFVGPLHLAALNVGWDSRSQALVCMLKRFSMETVSEEWFQELREALGEIGWHFLTTEDAMEDEDSPMVATL